MKVTVKSSKLRGSVEANVSKSYAQRAYALAALSDSTSRITNTSWSDDAKAALGIAGNLGARIAIEDGVVQISPDESEPDNSWDVGEAGLSLRMFAPIAALLGREIFISGQGSLNKRPTDFIVRTLLTMGVRIEGEGLPLKIIGPMQPGTYSIDGTFSSQLLTGLLIAMPLLEGNSRLLVDNLKSIPYIDMTLDMIRRFGGDIRHTDYKTFDISGGQTYHGANVQIEADWSGLAFLLVAAAITRKPRQNGGNAGRDHVIITGVQKNSLQADWKIVDALQSTGCAVNFNNGGVSLTSTELIAFTFDATHCPDLFPPLCVLATQCTGVSRIIGVHRLRHKESDRGMVLQTELGKLGAAIEIDGDVMIVKGKQVLNGAVVDACGDHRIAMALVCAGLVASGETDIVGAECISKSYQNFYTHISDLGGYIEGDKELFAKVSK